MLFFTGMGWIVPVIWIGSFYVSGQLSEDTTADLGMGMSHMVVVFAVTAILSSTLVLLAAAVLNRTKVPTTIRPLGRERVVMWGRHTLMFMPLGFWVVAIPVMTVFGYVIDPLTSSLADSAILQPDQPATGHHG